MAAGSTYGYALLWMVTLSTAMLILLQHNAAHLGIVTGYCISEAATRHLKPWVSRTVLSSAVLAAAATAMAEILGAAIALQMLFHLPHQDRRPPDPCGCFHADFNQFLFPSGEIHHRLCLADRPGVHFRTRPGADCMAKAGRRLGHAARIPQGSIPIVMSVLGAVVMPHNLFLHSEIIQSRQWHVEAEPVIARLLKYEFLDTLFSMIVGWGINSAMILVAAAVFSMPARSSPILSGGIAAPAPSGECRRHGFCRCAAVCRGRVQHHRRHGGGSIFAGMFGEPYNSGDRHTRHGSASTLVIGTAIFAVDNPFNGLILSQILLSVQLPGPYSCRSI